MRFVSTETVRIALANDQWIEVKKELGKGDDATYKAAGLGRMMTGKDGQELGIDFKAMALARVAAYLVDWSAKKLNGKPEPVSLHAIEALSKDSFKEIDDA